MVSYFTLLNDKSEHLANIILSCFFKKPVHLQQSGLTFMNYYQFVNLVHELLLVRGLGSLFHSQLGRLWYAYHELVLVHGLSSQLFTAETVQRLDPYLPQFWFDFNVIYLKMIGIKIKRVPLNSLFALRSQIEAVSQQRPFMNLVHELVIVHYLRSRLVPTDYIILL